MTHSFEIAEAEKYGVNAAIVIDLIRGWIAYNKANKKNEKEGRTWTYNSVKSWTKLVPYLTPKQVRTAIDVLIAAGLVVKSNFNENHYDQTLWYALGDLCPVGQMEKPPAADQVAPGGKSLDQGINTEKEPPETNELTLEAERFVVWFIELLGKTGAPASRLTPTVLAGWRDTYEKLRRIDGKEKAEIAKVCEWARGDPFWSTNFYAPTKLRERKDGISRYDLFLERLKKPNGTSTTVRPNGRYFEQAGSYAGITDK